MLLRHWITEKSIYQQQTRWFLAQVTGSWSYIPVWKERENAYMAA
jgi:hypothetical protein